MSKGTICGKTNYLQLNNFANLNNLTNPTNFTNFNNLTNLTNFTNVTILTNLGNLGNIGNLAKPNFSQMWTFWTISANTVLSLNAIDKHRVKKRSIWEEDFAFNIIYKMAQNIHCQQAHLTEIIPQWCKVGFDLAFSCKEQ